MTNRASAFCWAIAPASVAGLIAPARVNGVATTAWPWVASSMTPSDIGPSSRSGEFVLMIVIRLGRRSELVAVDPAGQAGDLDRVVDDGPPEAEAVPGLVEQGGQGVVHVEMAGLDRQVGRLERAAALLVDDVQAADEPDVVDEVGHVARPPAALDVGHEGRPADGAEDEVPAAEADVARRVPGVEGELRRRESDELLDEPVVEPDDAPVPIDRRPGPGQDVDRRGRRGPRPRSRAGSGARRGGSPRPGPR